MCARSNNVTGKDTNEMKLDASKKEQLFSSSAKMNLLLFLVRLRKTSKFQFTQKVFLISSIKRIFCFLKFCKWPYHSSLAESYRFFSQQPRFVRSIVRDVTTRLCPGPGRRSDRLGTDPRPSASDGHKVPRGIPGILADGRTLRAQDRDRALGVSVQLGRQSSRTVQGRMRCARVLFCFRRMANASFSRDFAAANLAPVTILTPPAFFLNHFQWFRTGTSRDSLASAACPPTPRLGTSHTVNVNVLHFDDVALKFIIIAEHLSISRWLSGDLAEYCGNCPFRLTQYRLRKKNLRSRAWLSLGLVTFRDACF